MNTKKLKSENPLLLADLYLQGVVDMPALELRQLFNGNELCEVADMRAVNRALLVEFQRERERIRRQECPEPGKYCHRNASQRVFALRKKHLVKYRTSWVATTPECSLEVFDFHDGEWNLVYVFPLKRRPASVREIKNKIKRIEKELT